MGSGFRTFASGETLTSSNVQNYLMDQSVMVFAGTAARGSAIASPESGMVSYRTDGTADSKREGFEFYDGASWTRLIPAATPGGLVYLTGASFTTVTSFSLPTDTFTSTYRNYLVQVNISSVTSDVDFTGRLRIAGSDMTSSNYTFSLVGLTNAGGAANNAATAQTSWTLGEQDSSATLQRYQLFLDLLQPKVNAPTVARIWYNFVDKPATVNVFRMGTLTTENSQEADSFSFISSVASSITGSYRVYGYSN